jgi:hypothetical protein
MNEHGITSIFEWKFLFWKKKLDEMKLGQNLQSSCTNLTESAIWLHFFNYDCNLFCKMSQHIDSKVFTEDKHFLKIIPNFFGMKMVSLLFFEWKFLFWKKKLDEIRCQNFQPYCTVFNRKCNMTAFFQLWLQLLKSVALFLAKNAIWLHFFNYDCNSFF